jgi:protein phosphatase
MKYELKSYSIWEFGQRKDAAGNPHQEDSIFPAQGTEKDSDRLFILCDGMGGHDAGEVASATVCEAMSADILARCSDAEGEFTDEDFLHALDAAYDALDKHDNGAVKKMGTTMTFLKLHQGGATVAHLGDSRVYHIRPGKTGKETQICFVTEDHSLVNDLVRVGEMTHEEARHSKQKNIITRAMQPGQERRCKADIHHITDIRPNDYFYLCSDGMLEQDEMEDGTSLRNIFSDEGPSSEDKVRILIGATDENRDNHSALIIHITHVIDPLPLEQPADAQPEDSTQNVKEEVPLSFKKHVA